jgi:hypothetical protein
MKTVLCSKMRNLQKGTFEVEKKTNVSALTGYSIPISHCTSPGLVTKMTKISRLLNNKFKVRYYRILYFVDRAS